jgi:NAD-dependent deacetylase
MIDRAGALWRRIIRISPLFTEQEKGHILRIVFFTGAGISQESGLPTFRDTNGLWEGSTAEEVCSARAWEEAPARVLEFYNERRRAVHQASPNAAHKAITALEASYHQVNIVTQNVDDLHERAGSGHVLHLHGEIMKSRSVLDGTTLYDCSGDINSGDTGPMGGQMRPHIVFFGETIYNYSEARSVCRRADILVVVGTSLAVYPAVYLVQGSSARTIYLVDPTQIDPARFGWEDRRNIRIRNSASVGVPEAIRRIQASATG